MAKKPEIVDKYPWLRKHMVIQGEVKKKAKALWGQLIYQTRLGLKRKREDKNAPLFMDKFKILFLCFKRSHPGQ